jgi:hypothetical protein
MKNSWRGCLTFLICNLTLQRQVKRIKCEIDFNIFAHGCSTVYNPSFDHCRLLQSDSQHHQQESQYHMTICAHVFEISKVHLWGLDGGQRLHRQLNEINKTIKDSKERFGWVDHADDLPKSGRTLIFNGRFIFENRTIQAVFGRAPCFF